MNEINVIDLLNALNNARTGDEIKLNDYAVKEGNGNDIHNK
jgi:hypothetical protein